jgi:PAS domain S-box-containing protein
VEKMAVVELRGRHSSSYSEFTVLNYLPFAVLVFDFSNRLIFYNKQADNLFKLKEFSEEEFYKFRVDFGSTLAYIQLSHGNGKPRYGLHFMFNDQKYVYDLIPASINGQDYKMVIIKNSEKMPQIAREVEALREENRILKKIIDSSYDGIYITDGEGKTLYFNEAFIRISGFKREEAVGEKVQDLVNRGYLPKSCAAEVIRQRKSISMTIDYPNGTEGMLSGSPVFDENGNIIRTVLNVRDMSELNRLNEELKKAEKLTAGYRQQLKEVQMEYQQKSNIIYQSKAMVGVLDLASKAAHVDSPVLILGESGCGKDVIAKFIHNIGERAESGSLVKINCGAIPETLLESELFGYEPGAFTGARSKGKVGLFELADGGTFFLDEIGDMPLNLQVKLLDVLQEGVIHRIGGTKPIPVDVRIIAATNKDLQKMVSEGKFRLDLFYRLNVISINIPPLRERKEDILPLISKFLKDFNKKYNTKKRFSHQAIEQLLNYDWPGNIRELRNVVERLVVTTEGKEITEADLPREIRAPLIEDYLPIDVLQNQQPLANLPLKHLVEEAEKKYISTVLDQSKTLKEAAGILGIDISTLVRKKQKYKI